MSAPVHVYPVDEQSYLDDRVVAIGTLAYWTRRRKDRDCWACREGLCVQRVERAFGGDIVVIHGERWAA